MSEQRQNHRPAEPRPDNAPLPADRGKHKAKDGERQIDDNQDDLGRDVNDPSRVSNEVNRKGH